MARKSKITQDTKSKSHTTQHHHHQHISNNNSSAWVIIRRPSNRRRSRRCTSESFELVRPKREPWRKHRRWKRDEREPATCDSIESEAPGTMEQSLSLRNLQLSVVSYVIRMHDSPSRLERRVIFRLSRKRQHAAAPSLGMTPTQQYQLQMAQLELNKIQEEKKFEIVKLQHQVYTSTADHLRASHSLTADHIRSNAKEAVETLAASMHNNSNDDGQT